MAAVNPKPPIVPRGQYAQDLASHLMTNWENWGKIRNQFQVYNVLDYGAKGDGVANDTTAIQNCLSAARAVGGTVVFPVPGTYICKSQWDVSGITVRGAGMGTGSTQQTIIQFAGLGTDAAIVTRLASSDSFTSSLSNIRIEANSWDATTGCRGYGIDIEARINIDNVLVYGFYKSNVIFHGGVSSGGPYNSRIKNLYSMFSKEHGILVGTGANNLSFYEPYCAYNGSPSFGVAPTSSGLYDGFHVERDNDGNPGSAYLSYVPEAVNVYGGNGFNNSRYGWYLRHIQNSAITTGYCEANYGAAGDGKQVYLGNDVKYCTVNVQQLSGGVANLEMAASFYRYNNTVFCEGGLVCSGANKENYLLANLQNYLGTTGDPYGAGITDGAYLLYTTDSGVLVQRFFSFGSAVIRMGGTTYIETGNGKVVLPATYYIGGDTTTPGILVQAGTGSPEGSVTGNVGSLVPRTDGAGQLYRKASGTGNTGWVQMYGNKDNPTFGPGNASAFASIDAGDGAVADIGLKNAGVEVWTIRKEATAISGGSTGTGGASFELISRNNSSTLVDKPVTMGRAATTPIVINRQVNIALEDLKISTVGKGLYIKEGTNATLGVATLVAGTVTVSNTKVTASSRIMLAIQSLGTVTAPKAVGVTARVAGTSFTITSADATDTSVIAWQIVEPA